MIHWIFIALLAPAIGFTIQHIRKGNLWNDTYFIPALISWALAVIAGMVWGALALSSAECSRFSLETGLDTDFYAIGGCYVEADGRSIPVDEDSITLLVRELTK